MAEPLQQGVLRKSFSLRDHVLKLACCDEIMLPSPHQRHNKHFRGGLARRAVNPPRYASSMPTRRVRPITLLPPLPPPLPLTLPLTTTYLTITCYITCYITCHGHSQHGAPPYPPSLPAWPFLAPPPVATHKCVNRRFAWEVLQFFTRFMMP